MPVEEAKEIAIEQIRVRVLPDGRMTRRDAAHYLGNAEKTLAMWAMVGKGPPGNRVGGRVCPVSGPGVYTYT